MNGRMLVSLSSPEDEDMDTLENAAAAQIVKSSTINRSPRKISLVGQELINENKLLRHASKEPNLSRPASRSQVADGSDLQILVSGNKTEELKIKPLIGDIKCTLDDLKSCYLNYYTKVYAFNDSIPIENRLKLLSNHMYPTLSYSPLISDNAYTRRVLANSLRTQNEPQGAGEFMFSDKSELAQDFSRSRHDSSKDAIKSVSRSDFRGDENFEGTLQAESLYRKESEPSDELKKKLISPKTRYEHSTEQICTMLDELKKKTISASRRLRNVKTTIAAEIGDPNIREWELNTAPQLYRRTVFGRNSELKNHVTNLYASLHAAAQINEQKIATLSAQMKLLAMNTQRSRLKSKDDPRVAF